MAYYSYKLKDEDTGFGQNLDWRINWNENLQKERTQEEKEIKRRMSKFQQQQKLETEEFIKPFLMHPISEEIIEQFRKIEPTNRKRVDPAYILDKQLDIIAMVESKNLIGKWIFENGHSKKELGRTTVFEYIRNKWEYKNTLYFVEGKNYEEFIKKIA
ncbi:hypothetical protein [Neobacillus drentensis]|uniref:hypothetical protein n=1 Tax=Neobacillus drentensis TaxID=220684 RepID=UPI0008264E2C|nr:hypothetical protein [Neobacillus drentensis]